MIDVYEAKENSHENYYSFVYLYILLVSPKVYLDVHSCSIYIYIYIYIYMSEKYLQ